MTVELYVVHCAEWYQKDTLMTPNRNKFSVLSNVSPWHSKLKELDSYYPGGGKKKPLDYKIIVNNTIFPPQEGKVYLTH